MAGRSSTCIETGRAPNSLDPLHGVHHLTVLSGGYGSAPGEKINKLSQIESNFHENEYLVKFLVF